MHFFKARYIYFKRRNKLLNYRDFINSIFRIYKVFSGNYFFWEKHNQLYNLIPKRLYGKITLHIKFFLFYIFF